jgi:glutamine amidotransferase PdxT
MAIAAFLTLPMTVSRAAEDSKSDTIGPWDIEATFKADKFDRCSISRKLDDDIVASFVRTGDGLTLVLLREGRFLVAAFHPELTEDTRVHELFLDRVREAMSVRA